MTRNYGTTTYLCMITPNGADNNERDVMVLMDDSLSQFPWIRRY